MLMSTTFLTLVMDHFTLNAPSLAKVNIFNSNQSLYKNKDVYARGFVRRK